MYLLYNNLGDFMKKPELLAPAGNMESLKAAIAAGCDAIYLGGYQFGARSFAGNFSNEELKEAVEYAHLRNVKVYVTVNTLVYEEETELFFSYIDFLYHANVDALLIQDLGMMDYIRKVYPDMELHASTQMHIHNLDGVKFAERMGLKRVVLARETPIELVKEIRNQTNLELELFVHGALCISYSGQCFMSYLNGGRSGNRGTCAQSCRQKYQLYEEQNGNRKLLKEGYLLSTRDLNTLEHIGELIEAGVDSLKIEGRMKRPEYVYYVVSLYRKAIDSYLKNQKIEISDSEIKDLKKLFHRTFTKGFLFHEKNDHFIHSFRPNHLGIEIGEVCKVEKDMISIRLKEEVSIHDGIRIFGKEDVGTTLNVFYKNGKIVKKAYPKEIITLKVKGRVENHSKVVKTTDQEQLDSLQKEIQGKDRRIPIKGICKIDDYLELTLICGKDSVTVISDFKVEKAKNQAITKEKITEQISKLGDSVYKMESLDISLREQSFVTIKALNELRRNAVIKLNEKRLERKKLGRQKYTIILPDFEKKEESSLYVKSLKSYQNHNKYDVIYAEEPLYSKLQDPKCILKLPRVMDHYPKTKDRVLVGEVGGLHYASFDTDFSIHVTNSYTLAFLHSIGANKVTLSYECSMEQIKSLLDAYEKRYHKHPNVEVLVSYYPEAMIMKYNPFSDYGVDHLILKDRFQNEYQFENKNKYVILYDRKKKIIDHPETLYQIGVNSLRVEE